MGSASMAETQLKQSPPSSSSPPPSVPLQLSGFLSGDTIQVQGDTETLQFSVQFNIRRKQHNHPPDSHFHFPITNTTQDQSSLYSASSYMTPITNNEYPDQNLNADPAMHQAIRSEKSEVEEGKSVLTRLRSGVLSRVEYFPPRRTSEGALVCGRLRSWRKRRAREKGKEKEDMFERVLRRRSLPVRPCSSYAFFVMAAWGAAKSESFSFGETSKRLGKMWCSISHDEKKIYEDMALKDNARYKRQCRLLKK